MTTPETRAATVAVARHFAQRVKSQCYSKKETEKAGVEFLAGAIAGANEAGNVDLANSLGLLGFTARDGIAAELLRRVAVEQGGL